MKKILLILSMFQFVANAQIVNKFRDSTWFKSGVQFDGNVVFKSGAGSGKVWTSNSNGTGSWQTISTGGDSIYYFRNVDSIYRIPGKDSIVFKINGVHYSVLDSTGSAQDISGLMVKSSNLSDVGSVSTARTNLGLGTLATQNGTFSGTSSGTNTGDQDLSSYATKTNLKDTSNLLRSLISSIATPDAQTLATTYADSISLSISGGNTIKFAYAVDSVSKIGDSLIVIKAGVRLSYLIGSSGGGSLSALTAATAVNIINNNNYKQRWNWPTLAGDTAIALTSNSTGAASNLQNVLTVSQSGANSTSSQSTYALKVSNKKTGTSAINYAGYFEASGGWANYAGVFDGQVMSLSGGYRFTSGGSITEGGSLSIASGSSRAIFLNPAIAEGVDIITATGNISHNFYEISGTRSGVVFGGRYTAGIFEPFSGTTIALVQRDTGKLKLCAGTSISSGFTPPVVLTVQGSTTAALGNVGIGTTAPVASAKLEISSSNMGFLPPRMTTTERDAISSPATGLMVYDTTVNKVSVYNGSVWKYLQYE